jgi:hypothetical protein
MSIKDINGKQIEVLSDSELSPFTRGFNPGFFEPKPLSPKAQPTDNNNNNKAPQFTFGKSTSILGKRKAEEAFDVERYGQTISVDYFKNGTGHGVTHEINNEKNNVPETNIDFEFNPTSEQIEILEWVTKYQENKKKCFDFDFK